MTRKRELGLAELADSMLARAARARLLFFGLAGASLVLFVINAATQSSVPLDAPLAHRWWFLIPMLVLAALAAIVAAHELWLLPRRVAVSRWLVAARPLHRPLLKARAAEERIARLGRSTPGDHSRLDGLLSSGHERLTGLLESPIEGDEARDLRRRAAMIDAYRVALTTIEIDALIKKDFVGSSAFEQALERAVELLGVPARELLGPGEVQPEASLRFQSIAVLPFADLSPLGDQEHFSYGLAEELIDALTKLQKLRVIARGLAFSFAGKDLTLREIGRRLGVETVLEGSVQKSGDRARVSAHLIAVVDGQEIWEEDFDEKMEEVYMIQQGLADGVVRALGVTPTANERRAIKRPATRVTGAYDYYLRGRRYFAQYHGRGIAFALDMFNRAIELDPEYALAHAGVADCCAYLYANAGRTEEHRQRALEASERALELDPELAEAHVSRGVALSLGDRAHEAGQFFDTAIRLDPKLFDAHYFYARHHFTCGESEKAIQHYEAAARLRPEDYQVPLLSAQIYDDLGRTAEGTENRQRGVRAAEEHLKLSPDDARALYIGGNALVCLGRVEEGLDWARRARELQPKETMLLYNLACIYSLAGEVDQAIDSLTTAIQHGFSYRDWAEHDSNLDTIRDDPRFVELMRRLSGDPPTVTES